MKLEKSQPVSAFCRMISKSESEVIQMYSFPIGVILESFRTDRSTAIKKAAAIGANGIQMYATQGENSP